MTDNYFVSCSAESDGPHSLAEANTRLARIVAAQQRNESFICRDSHRITEGLDRTSDTFYVLKISLSSAIEAALDSGLTFADVRAVLDTMEADSKIT